MIKLDIVGAVVSILCCAVGVTVALTVAQDAWKANEHAKAVWWGFAVWIIVGIGVAATALPMAYKADKQGLDSPRTSAVTTQRPWITVKSVQLENGTIAVGNKPTVIVEFENTGQAPALNVSAFGIIGLANVITSDDPGDEPYREFQRAS